MDVPERQAQDPPEKDLQQLQLALSTGV